MLQTHHAYLVKLSYIRGQKTKARICFKIMYFMAVAGVVVEQTPNIQLSMTISDNMMIYCMPLSLIFMLETEHYSLS